MKLFLRYLAGKARTICIFALFALLFAVTFRLYGLPLQAVWYPSALCLLLGMLALAVDFGRVRRQHRMLSQLLSRLPVLPEVFPAAQSIPEADLQALVQALCAQQQAAQTAMASRCQQMLDYYTLWVHQIKTPISAMRLTLQTEDSEASRQLSLQLGRIEGYVEMVLAYLRLDSESTDYVFRTCALDALIRRAVRKFSGEFISRRLRLDYAPVTLQLVTDEKWLQFVLEQLLSNALKYTPEGSVRIFLSGERTLAIQDTGIGVAPEDLPRIFERGFTGYNGRGEQKSSGLGLYLCRMVCEKLGCGLRAASRPGAGTTIFLDFPPQDAPLPT